MSRYAAVFFSWEASWGFTDCNHNVPFRKREENITLVGKFLFVLFPPVGSHDFSWACSKTYSGRVLAFSYLFFIILIISVNNQHQTLFNYIKLLQLCWHQATTALKQLHRQEHYNLGLANCLCSKSRINGVSSFSVLSWLSPYFWIIFFLLTNLSMTFHLTPSSGQKTLFHQYFVKLTTFLSASVIVVFNAY